MLFLVRVLLSALVIAGVSQLAKTSNFLAAVLISLPLTSILALAWRYYDTRDAQQVIALSYGILWLVVPSLVFFIALPVLLQLKLEFPIALGVACVITAGVYCAYVLVMKKFGISVG